MNLTKMRHQRDRAIGYQHFAQRWMLGVMAPDNLAGTLAASAQHLDPRTITRIGA